MSREAAEATGKAAWMIDIRPLRFAPYRRMWIGNGLSFFGFQFTSVAVPVQMYAVTHSSAWVGLLGVAGLVPLLVFGLWGGAAADVVDRRKLLLASSTLAWLSTVGLLVQALTAPYAILASVGTFLWSASWAGTIQAREPRPERAPGSSLLREVREGVAFIVRDPVLRQVAGATGTANLWSAAAQAC